MKSLSIQICFLFLLALPAAAQLSQKEARDKKVKSVSEWETDLRERKPEAILETYAAYDQDGNLLEIKERDGEGVITKHEKYTYDQAGNKLTEEQYDEDGDLKKKHVYTYKDGLKVSRRTYSSKGELIGEKKYVYEFHK